MSGNPRFSEGKFFEIFGRKVLQHMTLSTSDGHWALASLSHLLLWGHCSTNCTQYRSSSVRVTRCSAGPFSLRNIWETGVQNVVAGPPACLCVLYSPLEQCRPKGDISHLLANMRAARGSAAGSKHRCSYDLLRSRWQANGGQASG